MQSRQHNEPAGQQRSQRSMSSGGDQGPGHHHQQDAAAAASSASVELVSPGKASNGSVNTGGGSVGRTMSLAHREDVGGGAVGGVSGAGAVHVAIAPGAPATPRRPWGHRRMHSCPTVPHQFGALSLVSLTPTTVSRSPSLKQHQQHHLHHQSKHRRLASAHLPPHADGFVGGQLQPLPPPPPAPPLPTSLGDRDQEEAEEDAASSDAASNEAGKANTQCGWFCYRPRCLQPLAHPVPFTAAVIGLYFVQSFIVSGYINSINTTIELRYGLSTREIGYIYASYEVACILASFFISYFGHGRNRARLLGAGCLVIALGYLLFAFPHFLGSSISNLVGNLTDGPDRLCPATLPGGGVAAVPVADVLPDRPDCKVQSSALMILCVSFALVGLGASPVYILAPTYLWDNVPQYSYPVYAASLHITSALGPACGFLGGALFLSMYVSYPQLPPENLNSSHPLWAGAWWMGFLVFSGLAVLVAVPLLAFPTALPPRRWRRGRPGDANSSAASAGAAAVEPTTTLPEPDPCRLANGGSIEIAMLEANSSGAGGVKKADKAASLSTTSTSTSSVGGQSAEGISGSASQPHIRDIPAGLVRLFNNPLWLFISLLIVAEQSVVQAFVAYVNKYMQKSFGLPVTRASIVTGLLVIPSAVIGIGAGAFFMRRFCPSSRAVSLTMMVLCVCTTLLTTLLVLCTCDNIQLAGLTTNYQVPGASASAGGGGSDPALLLLNATCNAKCECVATNYDPVCDQAKRVNYYSPCHAGCSNKTLHQYVLSSSDVSLWNYTDCACVPRQGGGFSGGGGGGGTVTNGKCDNTCSTFLPFCVLLFLIVLLTACGYEPCHILTLSCVSESDSSFALGMQNVLQRILAFIPAPIYFGSLFDSNCLLRARDSACDAAGSACMEYDLSRLPYMWIGVILALKLLGFLFASASYFSCRSSSHAVTLLQPDAARGGGGSPGDGLCSTAGAGAADDAAAGRSSVQLSAITVKQV